MANIRDVVVHPLIKRLRETAPQIRVAVMPFEVADLSQKLAAGHIDLALPVPEFAPQDLPSRLLFHERYAVAVGADHPLVGQDMTLETYAPTTMPSHHLNPIHRWIRAQLVEVISKGKPDARAECEPVEGLKLQRVSNCNSIKV